MQHALAAGDAAWAARLAERHVETLLGRGEGATLRRWLSALPAESVRERPRLYLAQGYGAAMGFQLEALEALLDNADRAFAVSGDQPYDAAAGRAASVVANVPAAIVPRGTRPHRCVEAADPHRPDRSRRLMSARPMCPA